MPEQTRQLAAIMFTDIVGYTALMGKDSQKALGMVRQSKQIQKPLVEKYNGKWLKEMGDGAMARFSTALDAVNCALDIQRASRADFDANIRIGIHLGDITIENNDVYGDGVNVAARLESIADPGGIYISDSIEKAIRGQTPIQSKYLGEINLKNVDYGVRTYAMQGVGLPIPQIKEKKEISGKFLAELKRRGVLRVGITYIAFSLLVFLLLPHLRLWITLPAWLDQVLMAFLIIVFPLAMFLAWSYERSPKGFVRTTSRQSWQNPYSFAKRKPLAGNVVIVSLLLAIVFLYTLPRHFSKGRLAEELKPKITDKSLAVLPFDNLSNDPDQEYFSDGMMEAILNHLAKIEGLRLTSRTTMMHYKGNKKNIRDIATEVGVRYLLEGSVQKSTSMFRITAQLIDAEQDVHIWSESYDQELSDVLKVQSDVAKSIAEKLEMSINASTMDRIEALPTKNPEAYDLYLQARREDFLSPKRRDLAEKAIALDPGFASAYAELAMYWLERGSLYGDLLTDEVLKKAEPLLNKAIALDHNNIMAHEILWGIYLWYKWDFNAAEREYRIVQQLAPSRINTLQGDLLLATGKYDKALELADKLLQVEPNRAEYIIFKGFVLSFLNRPDEALSLIEPTLKRTSPVWYIYSEVGRAYLYLGYYDRVAVLLEEAMDDIIKNPRTLGILAIAYYHLGRFDDQKKMIEEMEKLNAQSPIGSPAFYLAMNYAQMGQVDLTFEWLEKAYLEREVEMYWLMVEPPFEPIRNDPRYLVMLDRVGFPD